MTESHVAVLHYARAPCDITKVAKWRDEKIQSNSHYQTTISMVKYSYDIKKYSHKYSLHRRLFCFVLHLAVHSFCITPTLGIFLESQHRSQTRHKSTFTRNSRAESHPVAAPDASSQCWDFFFSNVIVFQQWGELWVIEKLKGEREVEAERADRGSDRCCGPEEERPCDRLSLTRPSWGKKKRQGGKKKHGCHGYRGRLREKMGWESSLLRGNYLFWHSCCCCAHKRLRLRKLRFSSVLLSCDFFGLL